MLTIRLSVAGILLLTYLLLTGKNILEFGANMGRQLIVFGYAGMLGVQFTFVVAINESNAACYLLQF